MARGRFFLVAGPAGVGKTTLLQRWVTEERRLVKAVSVTTREPRPGEVEGIAYHFWTDEKFSSAIAAGEFLEHAVVHGSCSYGTLRRFVDEQLAAGLDVVKDIDVQGVEQIRKLPGYGYPQTVAIFVLPPSDEELFQRLRGRGSENDTTLRRRLQTAKDELKRAGEYDYHVVNDTVEHALGKLKAIRLAESCRNRGGQQ